MAKKVVYKKDPLSFSNKKNPLVSVVTTAYNNEKFNKKYFNTINNQTYKNIEVIFVDNLSTDNTVEDAKNRLKRGKVVASKVNTGCAGGNNLGVLEAKGKYIFLLGPDTWIDRRCVESLVKKVEKNDNNVYAARQMTYDGKEFISCGISGDLFGYPARTYSLDGKKQKRKIFYADGSGIFILRKNYEKVGMMDEETFLFAEDVDLSWKCHMIGMDVVPVHGAIIYHYSGGAVGIGGYPKGGGKYETNSNRRFMAERNIIRNILKNYRWWNILWVLPFYILINVFEMVAMVATGQFSAITKTYIKAYIWNLINLKSTLKKRGFIQKIRTVGDLGVIRKMHLFPHKYYALLELGVPKINV